MNINLGQEKFVHATNTNLLVSASAGSGKTTTMIKKLLHLIINQNISIKNILVLTFTEAAASDMKQRLYNSLLKMVSENQNKLKDLNSDSQEYKEIEEKLRILYANLEDIIYADIGTFHSIFKSKITKYFYELELDPAFGLADEQEQKILLNNAIDNVFEKYVLNEDKEFYVLQETFNKKRKDSAFKEVVSNLYFVYREKPDFDEWFNNCLKNNYDNNFKENHSVQYLYEHIISTLNMYTSKLSYFSDFAETEKFDKVASVLAQCQNQLASILAQTDFLKLAQKLHDFAVVGTLSFPRNLTVDYDDVVAEIKDFYKAFKKQIEDLKKIVISYDYNYFAKAFAETKSLIVKLYELIKNIDATYTKIKSKKSYLDFNDLQSHMLKLTQNPAICKEISNEYEYIFLDEFQDVNELQYQIIKNLAKPNNLNMIGDVKQSIYEFRLASPKIFLDVYDKYSQSHAINDGQVIELNKNYRSSNYVLQFSNYLFNELITKSTIGIDYKNTAQLEAGNDDLVDFDAKLKADNISNVSLNIILSESDNEDDLSEDLLQEQLPTDKKLNATELEAETVAKEVLRLLGKPYFNTKLGQVSLIEYKDIAVLTQDGNEFVNVLAQTFHKYKIPSFLTTKSSIFKTNEVAVLMSFLKILSNEIDDYAITTMLKSKMLGLSYNDLAKIRLLKNNKKVSYYECLLLLIQSDFENDNQYAELRNQINSFFERVSYYKQLLEYTKISDVLKKFMDDYNYLIYFKSMPDGVYKLNNINEFMKIVSTEMFSYNLSQLIEYLTELQNKDNFKINVSTSQNAVSVLTMHKSKGLEFPAVVIGQFGKNFNNELAKSDLIISQTMGIGIRHKDINNRTERKSLQFNANLIERKNTELKEKIRLLYVAATRAKNYLSIVGNISDKSFKKLQQKNIMQATNFMELALKVVVNNNPEFNVLQSTTVNKGHSNEFKLNVIKTSDFEFTENLKPDVEIVGDYNKSVISKLANMHNFKYDVQENVAVKNTVSSLLSENDYEHLSVTPQKLKTNDYEKNQELSLVFGTAVHAIMQQLTYTENDTQLLELINKVVYNSPMSAEVYDLIDVKKIKNAIDTVKPLLKNSVGYYKEKQFIFKDSYKNLIKNTDICQDVIVQGVVDLLIFRHNLAIIIDFKTNKGMLEDDFKQKYNIQLDLYATAVKNAFNIKNVKKYIYSFELNSLFEV